MKIFHQVLILCSVLCYQASSAQPKYEFRAAWIATVTNIDWPSAGNFNTESQKAEFIKLLDMHQRNGLNAVIVQVRPSTDAFYPSPLEPWSEWLTGKQGLPPSPYYDPLAFMISETHKRGMEFHAWCNPYRAEFSPGRSSIAVTHVTRLHPEWFFTYGGKRYFDPGNKEVQQYVTAVIRDLVKRYDIDAIHFDDYFYPYRVPGEQLPDDSSFARYNNGLSRDDWRRSNVDSVILYLSRAIKEENRYCKFGISPFGVWRNNDKDPEGSATKAGQTNYDDLYADILLWLRNGWIDYVNPQLYWEFGHKLVGYEILIDWWSKHAYGKQLYIGHGLYRAYERNSPGFKNPREIPNQIKKLREYPTVHGSVYFSSKSFINNPNGWSDSLRLNYYRQPALIAPMLWLDSTRPAKPVVQKQSEQVWRLSAPQEKRVKYFILYPLPQVSGTGADSSIFKILPATEGEATFNKNEHAELCVHGCAITVMNRNNLESDWEMIK
jgi:uncharacterized lipoprotein YddW (UPF0748 family)